MLVSPEDLRVYMDMEGFSNRQRTAASVIIDGLTSEAALYLRRPIEVATVTESYVVPTDYTQWGQADVALSYDTMGAYAFDITEALSSAWNVGTPCMLPLRNTPVISVASVSVNGQTMVVDVDYVVRRFGIDLLAPIPGDKIQITYTAGIDGPHIGQLRLLILRAASREMQNMTDDVVGLKNLDTRMAAIATLGFTPDEKKSIKTLRRYCPA